MIIYVFLRLSEENAYPLETEMAEQLIMWAFQNINMFLIY